MGLVFELTDLSGGVLAEFERRTDVEVVRARNQIATAKLTVPAADEKSLCQSLRTRLRAYLDGDLIVNGPAIPLRSYHTGRVTIVGHGASRQLEHSFVKLPAPWATPHPALTFAATDQGLIIAALVAHADATAAEKAAGIPSHGIVMGSIEPSAVRARGYEPGKQIWDAIYELTQVINGPDVEEVPVVASDGTCSQMVVRVRQGADRSQACLFSYGTVDSNCEEFTEEPDGLATRSRFTSLGQPGEGEYQYVSGYDEEGAPIYDTATYVIAPPSYISNQVQQLQEVGIWEGFEAVPDVSEAPTVAAHAQGETAKYGTPPVYYDIVPGPDAPRVGPNPNPDDPDAPDCWLGDFVAAEARAEGMRTAGVMRLDQVTYGENAEGVVQSKVQLMPIALVGGT